MADAGILGEDDRVELIEGEILEMASIGSQHAACVDRLNRFLQQGAGDRVVVRVQNPVRLSDLTEPQPDLALLRPRDDFYATAHPGPADTLLIVEVSHSTLGYDRGIKLPLYAAARIPEVWIVNGDEGVIEVYRDPSGAAYRNGWRLEAGDQITPLALPSLEIPVARILG
jgi:Uma2 family endonuclease